MEGRLQGRVVVITGGCGDIGRATAVAFAREGAKVILVDLLSSSEARAALGAAGGNPFVLFTGSWVGDVPSRGLLPYLKNARVPLAFDMGVNGVPVQRRTRHSLLYCRYGLSHDRNTLDATRPGTMGTVCALAQGGCTAVGGSGGAASPFAPFALEVALQSTLAEVGQGPLSRAIGTIGAADHWRVL